MYERIEIIRWDKEMKLVEVRIEIEGKEAICDLRKSGNSTYACNAKAVIIIARKRKSEISNT